jgi:hypothetical protein
VSQKDRGTWQAMIGEDTANLNTFSSDPQSIFSFIRGLAAGLLSIPIEIVLRRATTAQEMDREEN